MRRSLQATRCCILAVVLAGAIALTVASVAGARIPPVCKNCAALNKRYQHGVGRASAHDKTPGTPVTTFVRSNRLYGLAMSFKKGLDRDKDGIGCEKA
jgi:hypothetical protein